MAVITVHRQIVYRLLPQKARNWRWLESVLESQRHLYNDALQERIECYRKTGRTRTYFDQTKALTECRQEFPDMAGCPLAIQRGTLKRLDRAYKHFFRRVKSGGTPGFPRFKGRHFWNSIEIVSGVKVRDGKLHVPGFGRMAIRRRGGNPYPDGRPVSAVLKRTGGKWLAVVCFAVEVEEPADNGHAVGLDRNVGQVADSDGIMHRMPQSGVLDAKAKRLNRKLARQRKASRRRERTKLRLARVRRRIANRRRNWHHHVSRNLAGRAGTVVIEKLAASGMTRSAKGTADDPGTNVRAKSGLNREILNTGWTALRDMLAYKAASLIEVNPAYTSQTCHECGAVDGRSRRSQAEFRCVHCGRAANADINAARNILASGIGASARRGALTLVTPTTREIDRKAA